jgi:gas vesicle protein
MSDTRAQKNTRDAVSTVADASNTAVSAATSSAQRGAEAMQQNAQAAGDAMRQGGQAAAEVARRTSEAGAETWRRSAGAVAESQRQITRDAAEGLQGATRTVTETVQSTAEDVRALLTLPTVADRGLQDMYRGMNALVDGIVQTNLRATQELFRLANPAAFVELQQRFVRDYISVVLEGGTAIVRAVRQTAEQVLPPLEQHLRQRQQSNAGYQAAAE